MADCRSKHEFLTKQEITCLDARIVHGRRVLSKQLTRPEPFVFVDVGCEAGRRNEVVFLFAVPRFRNISEAIKLRA